MGDDRSFGQPSPSAHESMSANRPRTTRQSASASRNSSDGADPLRVRLDGPSLPTLLRILLILVTSLLVLYLLWRVRGVIRLLGISLFFALALFPVVDRVSARTRVPRPLVILVLYVLVALLITLIGYLVIPSLVNEVQTLSHDAPHYAAELRRNATFRRYDDRYRITARLLRDVRRLPDALGHLAGPLRDVTVGAFSFIAQLITVLAVTFLLALHGRDYIEMCLALTGARRERYRKMIVDIKDAVAGYTLGNIVISGLATTATWIVLSILGVPYALTLGLVVGFFDLIPLIGATLGAIIVAVATVPVSFPTATIVWIAFIIVWQRFEDYVVQPFVYGRALRVNPLVTIVSLLVGGELLGILGVLLAIPSAAAIQIVLREWWSARTENRGGEALDNVRPAPAGSPGPPIGASPEQ